MPEPPHAPPSVRRADIDRRQLAVIVAILVMAVSWIVVYATAMAWDPADGAGEHARGVESGKSGAPRRETSDRQAES